LQKGKKEMKNLRKTTIIHLVIVIVFLSLYALLGISFTKAEPLTDGHFILTVSKSGNYKDLEFVGYFNDCEKAIEYYKENCINYMAASCLLKEYSNLPTSHPSNDELFTFDITEPQSCGFVGVQKYNFIED
jgi:hypothetical protein